MQESLEIIKVKNLYKDEQKELKETEKVIARRNEDFEYKGTKSHDELVNEMIDEKRKLMMNIRSCNQEYKHYDVVSEQFDSAFIGKTIKKKELERMKKKEDRQERSENKRRQRILAKCKH